MALAKHQGNDNRLRKKPLNRVICTCISHRGKEIHVYYEMNLCSAHSCSMSAECLCAQLYVQCVFNVGALNGKMRVGNAGDSGKRNAA